MKTYLNDTMARLSGLTITLALFAGTVGALRGADIPTARGGGSRLLELSGRLVTTKVELATPKTMACAKCKDDYVTRVDWTARGASKPSLTVAKHLCEGCGNKWVSSGHGKAKIEKTVHNCNSCGAASLTCCSTR